MRYAVVPRTLVFLLCGNSVLLLRGAKSKRIWPGMLNGLGGHIEPGEDPLRGALREVREETGIQPESLRLRGLVHVAGHEEHAGVMLFVYVGLVKDTELRSSAEGTLEWHPLDGLPWDEMVADLRHLLLAVQHAPPESIVYGHYEADHEGRMRYRLAFDSIE